MDKIKRCNFYDDSDEMICNEWCSDSDVSALESEIERLNKEGIKAKDYMVELSKTVVKDGMDIAELRKEICRLKAENEAIEYSLLDALEYEED